VEVLVGLAASVGPTLVGLAAWKQAKEAKQESSRAATIVQGNGLGDVSKVSDKTLRLVEDLSHDVRRHGRWIVQHDIDHHQ
jgi:hypothetical protein